MKKLLLLSSFYILFITQSEAEAPANDEPCNAQTLTVASMGCEPTTTYSYSNATHSTAYGNTYCNATTNRDVWFKFTVPASGEATVFIATAGQGDMAVEVLTGSSCNGPLTITDQNTQGFPCLYILSNPAESRTFKNLTPGSTAYLRVYRLYNINNGTGAIKICVGDPSQLADEPCNAGFFPIESADPLGQNCEPTQKFSFSGATLTPGIPNPECIFQDYYPLVRDMWFKVKVPASGKINIGIKADGVYVNQVWNIQTFTANACTGPFTSLGCTSWDGVSNNPLKLFATYTNLTPNSTLYCRLVANSSGAQPDGQVKICVSSFNSIPPINNGTKVGIGIDTPFAKLDVVGTGIFRDNLTAGRDLEVRGNLIVQGNLVSKFSENGGLKTSGGLTVDSILFGNNLTNRKLVLYESGKNDHQFYGLGINGGTFRYQVDATGADHVFFAGLSNSSSGELLRIKGNGNVGIGTSSPTRQLSVNGSANVDNANANTGTVANTLTFGNNSGEGIGSRRSAGSNQFGLDFYTNSLNRLSITNGGNVGIGTTTPNGRLQFSNAISNRTIVLNESVANEHNYFGFGINNFTLRYQVADPNQSHVFFAGNAPNATGSNELFRIRGNGNVGIAQSNPNAPLQFANDTRNRKLVLFEAANNDHQFYGFGVNGGTFRYQVPVIGDAHVFFVGSGANSSTELFRIQSNGNVGINQSNPQVPLHFATDLGKKISLHRGGSGDAGFSIWGNELRIHSDYNGADITFGFDNFTNGFTERFRVQANGNATLAGTLTQNSDARLKTKITPLQNTLGLLQQLNGYSYYWKDSNRDSTAQIGLLAQEVQQVLPQLVKADDKGTLSVNYSGMVPVLLQAVKEQQSLIEKQQTEITELKKLIQQLLNK